MYAALWINPQPEKADERIVVCYPLLTRQNAAVAVLNSQRRAGAESSILSGEMKTLQHFLGQLDKADDSWDSLSDQELISSVEALAERYKVSIVDWDNNDFGEEPTEEAPTTASHLVLAVKKIPKAGFYPRLITKEGKQVWDNMFEKDSPYRKAIYKFKSDKTKMWAAAIILLRRIGPANVVFKKDPLGEDSSRKMAQQEINKRANRGNAKAITETEKVFDFLKGEGLVSRLTTEKFYETVKYASRYYITTYRWCKLRKGVTPGAVIQRLLSARGYDGGSPGKFAHKSIDGVTDILIEPEGKDVYFYLTTFLTKDQVILLFGLADEGIKDDKILKLLKTSGRKWVKTGVLVDPK